MISPPGGTPRRASCLVDREITLQSMAYFGFFLAFDEWHALAKPAHRPKILLLLANLPDVIAQVRAFGRCRTAREERCHPKPPKA
jgi:hypothetical protein